jgi:serine O-acetyltransferase
LVANYSDHEPLLYTPGHELPIPSQVLQSIVALRELLFPGFTAKRGMASVNAMATLVESRLALLRVQLSQQVFRGLHHRCPHPGGDCGACEAGAVRITDALLAELPELRSKLLRDVRAAYDGDPAASGIDEVAFSYPGVQAITIHRIAHSLYQRGVPIVPRMMSEIAHSDTGIDIHPGATIGEGFFIDHGTGVVIGETSTIGNRVRIYQGVTLGALSLSASSIRRLERTKRHPTIEDDVIIYANATILGGDTVIGKGAIIGGNCWITSSVAPGTRRTV